VPARRQLSHLGAGAIALALVLAGCAGSSIQTDASEFVGEHARTAVTAASATRAAEDALSALSRPPSAAQLRLLSVDAAQAHRSDARAGEWEISKSSEGGEEGAEEEDLPRAETEATEAATALSKAMSAVQAYVRSPSAATLAHAESLLAGARAQWNESISELWFLSKRSGPPIL